MGVTYEDFLKKKKKKKKTKKKKLKKKKKKKIKKKGQYESPEPKTQGKVIKAYFPSQVK